MIKSKYSTKQIVAYLLFIVAIVSVGFILDDWKEENHAKEIDTGNFIAYCTVEKIKPRTSHGKRWSSRKDVVYLYYERNDTIYHIIANLKVDQIEKLDIELQNSYKIKVAQSDRDIFTIDFSEKIDTLIDMNDYKYQEYQTRLHENILEK